MEEEYASRKEEHEKSKQLAVRRARDEDTGGQNLELQRLRSQVEGHAAQLNALLSQNAQPPQQKDNHLATSAASAPPVPSSSTPPSIPSSSGPSTSIYSPSTVHKTPKSPSTPIQAPFQHRVSPPTPKCFDSVKNVFLPGVLSSSRPGASVRVSHSTMMKLCASEKAIHTGGSQ